MRALFLAVLVACGSSKDTPPPAPPPPAPAPPQPVALAVVLYGAEHYMGNDDIETEDSQARYIGILKDLKKQVDGLDLVHQLPAGSKGELIVYADAAKIRVPMGPIANLTGEALGTQKDYYRSLGNSLDQGVLLATAELHKATAMKKVLIVIGDGNDTNNEVAKVSLAKSKKALELDQALVHAIIYKGPLSEPSSVVTALDPDAVTVSSVDSIGRALRSTLRACCMAPIARANAPALAVALVFNGQEVYAGNDDIEPADSKFRYPGILKDLAVGTGKPALPPGTVIGAVAFADHARVIVAFQPDARLELGTQKDYYKHIGDDLVEGVTVAKQELEETGAKRKLLIVVNDGHTVDDEHGKGQLASLRNDLLAEGGEIHAIVWAGALSATGPGPIAALDPNAMTIAKPSELPAALAKLLH